MSAWSFARCSCEVTNVAATVNDLTVNNGITITVFGSFNLTTRTLNLIAGSSINGNANGFKAALGPGGRTFRNGWQQSGGAHAGCGSESSGSTCRLTGIGRVYGSAFEPMDQGSGGTPCCANVDGHSSGGSGGAQIRIVVTGTARIDGSITVNGGTAPDQYTR